MSRSSLERGKAKRLMQVSLKRSATLLKSSHKSPLCLGLRREDDVLQAPTTNSALLKVTGNPVVFDEYPENLGVRDLLKSSLSQNTKSFDDQSSKFLLRFKFLANRTICPLLLKQFHSMCHRRILHHKYPQSTRTN